MMSYQKNLLTGTSNAITCNHNCCACGVLILSIDKPIMFGHVTYCSPACWAMDWNEYTSKYNKQQLMNTARLLCSVRVHYHSFLTSLLIAIGHRIAGSHCKVSCYVKFAVISRAEWLCNVRVESCSYSGVSVEYYVNDEVSLIGPYNATAETAESTYQSFADEITDNIDHADNIQIQVRNWQTCDLIGNRMIRITRDRSDGMILPMRFGVILPDIVE